MLLKRLFNILGLLLLSNIVLAVNMLHGRPILSAAAVLVSALFFIVYNVNPREKRKYTTRLEVLMGGRELVISSFMIFVLDICLYIFFISKSGFTLPVIIINEIICLCVILILIFNGTLRMICASTQLSIIKRVTLFFTWWIPVVNFFVFLHCCRIVKKECLFIIAKNELNETRKDNDICKTKYPLLLVHGIFWRDWQIFNYWGRITNELIRNGATVYYGNQQSAAPMEVGANDLKNQILSIIEQEKCEKVNIIAHSKGGLDARYLISCLGMDNYVASLTTVGTPHRGCSLLDILLQRVPNSIVHMAAKRYNSLYKKLGDTEPDFYSGICDLTTEKCEQFNKDVVNKENVLYQSVASKMSRFSSAGFPLNVGYAVLRRTDGENDGFVSVESSKWGEYLDCFETKRKRGVSHGDMIDLMRENIRGFDVCECYVELVKGLKSKGL